MPETTGLKVPEKNKFVTGEDGKPVFLDDTLVDRPNRTKIVEEPSAKDDAALKARVRSWKEVWGIKTTDLPPLERPFAKSVLNRLHQRWTVDRTASEDQLGGTPYSKTRRKALLELTGNYYLAEEYGLRSAKDGTPLDRQRGMRLSHESSSSYLRDNPTEGQSRNLMQAMLKEKGRDYDPKRMFFINSPMVVDRLQSLYGDALIANWKCPNLGCKQKATPTRRVKSGVDNPTCPDCGAPLDKYAYELVELSKGIHVLVCDLPSSGLKSDPSGNEGKSPEQIMEAVMHSIGATPSAYQVIHQAKKDHERPPLSDAPLDSAKQLDGLTGNVATKLALPKDSALYEVAHAASNLIAGLAILGKPRPYVESGEGDTAAQYARRREALEANVAAVAEFRDVPALNIPWSNLDNLLKEAGELALATEPAEAIKKLEAAEQVCTAIHKHRFDHDPLVHDALAQLEGLTTVMPPLFEDAPRAIKLFELMIDELHLALAHLKPYRKQDYQEAVGKVLKERAPSIGMLGKDVEVSPFLVSSGMDALTTAVLAGQKATGSSEAAFIEESSNYFEVQSLLSHSEVIKDHGPILVAALNPSTPTEPPKTVGDVITRVTQRLEEQQGGTPLSLILDVTVERQDKQNPKQSDLEDLFANAEIRKAINDGRLYVTLCKSYQKYPTLGTGKIMAGNVTVIAKKGTFSEGTQVVSKAEEELDFVNNDESQLMTHLIKHASGQETALMKRAADNAKNVHALFDGGDNDTAFCVVNEGLPFVMLTKNSIACQLGTNTRNVSAQEILNAIGLEIRDSFGFLNSSCLDAGTKYRLNTGQESPESLTEKFHAFNAVMIKAMKKHKKEQKEYDDEQESIKSAKTKYSLDMAQWREDKKQYQNYLTRKSLGLLAVNEEERKDPTRPVETKATKKYPIAPAITPTGIFDAMNAEIDEELKKAGLDPGFDVKATLPDKLTALGKLFKPKIPETVKSDDIAELKRSMTYGPEAEKLGQINNKIASYLTMLSTDLFRQHVKADDYAKAVGAFIESGMLGVTPEVQARLIKSWMQGQLAVAELADDEKGEAVAQSLQTAAARMPYREDKGALFVNDLPETRFAAMGPEVRQRLTKALYGGLDVAGKLLVVKGLIENDNLEKANSCLEHLQALVETARSQDRPVLRPDRLTSGAKQGMPVPLSDSEITQLETEIKALMQDFLDHVPPGYGGPWAHAEAACVWMEEVIGKAPATGAHQGAKRAFVAEAERALDEAQPLPDQLNRLDPTALLALQCAALEAMKTRLHDAIKALDALKNLNS